MEKSLTNSEREIMEVLWKEDRALSGSEIVALSEKKSWKESYIHLLINSLLVKDVIKIDGFMKTSKNYARTFVPTITEKEYSLMVLTSNATFKEEYIPFFVEQLLSQTKDEKIINDVKAIVNAK